MAGLHQAEQLVAQADAALPGFEMGFDLSVNRLATLTAGRSASIAALMQPGGGWDLTLAPVLTDKR